MTLSVSTRGVAPGTDYTVVGPSLGRALAPLRLPDSSTGRMLIWWRYANGILLHLNVPSLRRDYNGTHIRWMMTWHVDQPIDTDFARLARIAAWWINAHPDLAFAGKDLDGILLSDDLDALLHDPLHSQGSPLSADRRQQLTDTLLSGIDERFDRITQGQAPVTMVDFPRPPWHAGITTASGKAAALAFMAKTCDDCQTGLLQVLPVLGHKYLPDRVKAVDCPVVFLLDKSGPRPQEIPLPKALARRLLLVALGLGLLTVVVLILWKMAAAH